MWEYNYSDELYHHGVKGMKWGVRKKRPASLTKAKSNYKSAQDEYVKSFNKAYSKSLTAYSPFKKHRQNNAKRWKDANDKGNAVIEAKKVYKTEKNKYKNAKREDKAEDKKIKDSRKEDVKNVRKLSDADLKKKVERLSMEKKLKDLTSDDVSPGKKFVSGVMSSSGKKVATAFVTGAALYGTRAALTKEFNIAELGRYMTPKPKK